jgi:hypothetical protein
LEHPEFILSIRFGLGRRSTGSAVESLTGGDQPAQAAINQLNCRIVDERRLTGSALESSTSVVHR